MAKRLVSGEPPESEIAKEIASELRRRGAWAQKTRGDMYTAGLPDIVGCYEGIAIGLEVKRPSTRNNVSALQKATLLLIQQAGGVAAVIWSVKQVPAVIARCEAKLG